MQYIKIGPYLFCEHGNPSMEKFQNKCSTLKCEGVEQICKRQALHCQLFTVSFFNAQIKPVVQEVFPFSKTNEAYAKLESGHARGKIVVSMDCKQSAKEEHSV